MLVMMIKMIDTTWNVDNAIPGERMMVSLPAALGFCRRQRRRMRHIKEYG
jgi:hypothetical protein